MYTLAPLVLKEVLSLLSERFSSPLQIKSLTRLSKPERRNLIVRITLQPSSKDVPHQLIFKQSHHEKNAVDEQVLLERFARDWAGLEFSNLPNCSTTPSPPFIPKFYGGSKAHRFVLLEDLGEEHISLVDSLTSKDRKAAIASLARYMKAMARFHAHGHNRTDAYYKIVHRIIPGAKLWNDDVDVLLSKIEDLLKKLDVPSSSKLQEETRHVFKMMREPSPFTTLTHGDICPDNVFDDPQRETLHLIDFEWGSIGNALLDATYLRMSMPTCWCVKALPDEIIAPLESVYRQALMKSIPEAADDTLYNDSYVCACAYWVLLLIGYHVNDVLEKERDPSTSTFQNPHPHWKIEDNISRPRHLFRLQSFITLSLKYEKLPHLRLMAEQVLQKLKTRWPDTKPLELFSAFQSFNK